MDNLNVIFEYAKNYSSIIDFTDEQTIYTLAVAIISIVTVITLFTSISRYGTSLENNEPISLNYKDDNEYIMDFIEPSEIKEKGEGDHIKIINLESDIHREKYDDDIILTNPVVISFKFMVSAFKKPEYIECFSLEKTKRKDIKDTLDALANSIFTKHLNKAQIRRKRSTESYDSYFNYAMSRETRLKSRKCNVIPLSGYIDINEIKIYERTSEIIVC